MDIITDFKAIAEIARLRALDGRPQDEVVAGVVRAADPNCQKHALPNCSVCRIDGDNSRPQPLNFTTGDPVAEPVEPAYGTPEYWQKHLYGGLGNQLNQAQLNQYRALAGQVLGKNAMSGLNQRGLQSGLQGQGSLADLYKPRDAQGKIITDSAPSELAFGFVAEEDGGQWPLKQGEMHDW